MSPTPPGRRRWWIRPRVESIGITVGIVAAVYVLWYQVTVSGAVAAVVLPTPKATFESVVEVIQRETFLEHLRVTVTEVAVGLAVGASTAIAIALVCDRYEGVKRLLSPYIVAVAAIPKIAILPLLYVWLGIGYRSATAIVVLVVFFPVFLNTVTGLAIADPDGTRLMTSLGASAKQQFRYHRLPSALPLIFTGLKASVNYAVIAALTAELLGARYGLGFLIANSGNFLRIDELYATVVIATIFSAGAYLLFEVIDRKVVFWRPRDER